MLFFNTNVDSGLFLPVNAQSQTTSLKPRIINMTDLGFDLNRTIKTGRIILF